MSLRAKLEAVIYAAEEPVTLAQLAQIFAADALEWKAAKAAAAAESNAEIAGESADAQMPLDVDAASLGISDTVAMSLQSGKDAGEEPASSAISSDAPAPAVEPEAPPPAPAADADAAPPDSSPTAPAGETPAQPAIDPEEQARRLARQREREIKDILKQILDETIAAYEADDHGIEIKEIAGGYRMGTKPECHDAVRIFVKSLKPPLKLSLPALETLAVVAYKQPVTAPEVSEIRGVESGGVLGSLLARKLIATAGRKQVIGRPILYKTTKEFLLRFGLKDLTELPSMEEFEKMAVAEIEEMEPEAAAADAAEDAAEAAVESNETAENQPAPQDNAAASQETPTDETSAAPPQPSNEQPAHQPADAPPAEPESPAPAENEAIPDAEKVQEEH